MGQKKLQRFQEIKTFPNVFEYPGDIAGKWHGVFENENPIVLELACGKGEYTVNLAQMHPNHNYIGVDLKGNRLWAGAKKALERDLKNAAFLRTQIVKIDNYFQYGEVDEIWITFPDPHLRAGKAGKRLTHPRYLRLYQRILKPGATIHLKTDSPDLYAFTRQVASLFDLNILDDIDDVYALPAVPPELSIKTYYESLDIAQSKRVFYLRFQLPLTLPDNENALREWLKRDGPSS